MPVRSIRPAILASCLAFLLSSVPSAPARAEGFDVAAAYDKAEYEIAMRDGTKLHTIVYTPKDRSQRYPILFRRTPYSVAPYGAGRIHEWRQLAPAEAFLRDGYIFAIQDVRGRYKSEGQWDNYRLLREGRQGIDETTDTFDTIDWLPRGRRARCSRRCRSTSSSSCRRCGAASPASRAGPSRSGRRDASRPPRRSSRAGRARAAAPSPP